MLNLSIPYPLIMLSTGLLAAGLALVSLRSRHQRGAFPFSMLAMAISVWSLGYAAELMATTLDAAQFWTKIEYFGIVLVGPIWLQLALSIHHRFRMWKSWQIALAYVLPVIVLVSVLSNDFHQLYYKNSWMVMDGGWFYIVHEYGPLFWLHVITSYLFTILGTFVLVNQFLFSPGIERSRIALVIAPIFPIAANLLTLSGKTPLKYLDLTPFAFTITVGVLTWGLINKLRFVLISVGSELMVHHVNVGILILDYDGTVVESNKAAHAIFGVSDNRLIQDMFNRQIHPRQENYEEGVVEHTGWIRRQYIYTQITPIFENKRWMGTAVTLTNITPQKNSELALEGSKKHYFNVFNGIRDAIFIESQNGDILDVNEAACTIFGYTREELLTKKIADIVPENGLRIQPEQTASGVVSSFGSMKAPVVTVNRRSNGDVFPVEVFGRTIELDGRLVLLVLVRDITEKQKVEEAMREQDRYVRLINEITWTALIEHKFGNMLQILADRLGELFNASATYITLWDDPGQIVIPGAASGPMRDFYQTLKPGRGENTLTENVLKLGRPLAVDDVNNSPYLSVRIARQFPAKSMLAIPMIVREAKLGAVLIAYDEHHDFSEDEIRKAERASGPIALSVSRALLAEQTQELLLETRELNDNLEKMVDERTRQLMVAYDATIAGWAKALELREKETAGHCERTVDLSMRLARFLQVGDQEVEHIRRGALLHDIGKMGVPDEILTKPGSLTDSERKAIQAHPLYSKLMLNQIDFLRPATDIPYYHHERWDGTGYPWGLSGEKIPFAARLFAVVDVWDALTSDRPYHKALPESEVVQILRKSAGSQFDPGMVEAFLSMLHGGAEITTEL